MENPTVPGITERHQKQCVAMREFLVANDLPLSLKAFDLVQRIEEGNFRKDGETPLFHHQLSIGKYACTLSHAFSKPEADHLIATAFLHDLLEDHQEEWTVNRLEEAFGSAIANSVAYLSRSYSYVTIGDKIRIHKRGGPDYYSSMSDDKIACVIKLIDRAHNIQSMVGVFTLAKQKRYLQETEDYFFPMLKRGRLANPEIDMVFENIKINLRCQCRLIKAIHEGLENAAE